MLSIRNSNHFNASQNNSPYYNIRMEYPLDTNDIFVLLKSKIDFSNADIFQKFPWIYINFDKNRYLKPTLCWKVHISATIKNYKEVALIVAKYAVENNINFKFTGSTEGFCANNSKQIHPASAGKFMVLYCISHTLEQVLEDLYQRIKDMDGPYILSDRHYKDSENIYYRYGEYIPIPCITELGMVENFVSDNHYNLMQDLRKSYYQIPKWIEDKEYSFETSKESYLLKKYQIDEIISNGGSVTSYLGYCKKTQEKVFIKEARKYLGIDSAKKDSQDRLKNEYSFLKKIQKWGYSPKVFDFFEDGGNVYLVEEFIEGESLGSWLSSHNPLYRGGCSDEEWLRYCQQLNQVLIGLVEIIVNFYKEDVYLNDISVNNILLLVNEERIVIKFIDFEYAYSSQSTDIADMFTPGFSSRYVSGTVQSEIEKILKLLVNLYIPFTNMYDLCLYKLAEHIRWYLHNYSKFLQRESIALFCLMLSEKIKSFEDLKKIYEFDNALEILQLNEKGKCDTNRLLNDSIQGIKESACLELCKERKFIFPADPQLFNTNVHSLSHGSLGVLYSLNSIGSLDVDFKNQCLEYIIPDLLTGLDKLPKGLYMGSSGMAWILLDLGYRNLAEELMVYSNNIYNLHRYDLFYGLSGILLTNLKFYIVTNKRGYLKIANEIVDKLIDTHPDDIEDNGYGLGLSGIVVSLVSYYKVTKENKILSVAQYLMDAELSRCVFDDRGAIGINREGKSAETTVLSPYIYDGIAGIGVALLRLYEVTDREDYLDTLYRIIEASLLDATLFPAYMRGLSGIADFLMDCLFVIKEHEFVQKIQTQLEKIINNLKLFYSEDHKLFFGEQLYKLSADLTTGSAGIILVINRYQKLIEEGILLPSQMFLLDESLGILNEGGI